MAESSLVTLLVCVIAFMGVGHLLFMAWREIEHRKQIDSLTSKIMSKDYAHYASYRPEETKVVASKLNSERPRKMNDSTLGGTF